MPSDHEPPWTYLDPGIRAAVRELWDLGFRTTDSGDGRHKGTLGLPPDCYSPSPHVVIAAPPRELEQEADRLIEWMLDQGFEDDAIEIACFPYVTELEGEGILIGWVIRIAGDVLYNYVPR